MRKSELLRQNMELFKALDEAKKEIETLKLKLKKMISENEKKSNNVENIKETKIDNKSEVKCDNFLKKDDIELPSDLKYATEIISKLVIESANYSNILTANGEVKYKELVNLILGKTEVSKADIIAVANEQNEFSVKTEKMDNIYKSTLEYYESVLAQR